MHQAAAQAGPEKPAEPGALRKIDDAAIAPRPTRKFRAAAFQAYVLGASVVFVTLAVTAHFFGYFPIDLRITLAVQQYHGPAFATLMYWVSWLGFIPQVIVLCTGTILVVFLLGARWEAVALAFAGAGAGIGSLVKLLVMRPRPTASLVHVAANLNSSGFPSGHVLSCTAFAGFLVFLAYTLPKHAWGRTLFITLLSVLIGLMGLSRIYQGQHWFSDVMGAYLLGSLWLALTIRLYRWGKTRYFVRQPIAPEVKPPATTSAPQAS